MQTIIGVWFLEISSKPRSNKQVYSNTSATFFTAVPSSRVFVFVWCTDHTHSTSLEQYIRHVVQACLAAAEVSIPTNLHRSKSYIPGWSKFVAVARNESIFWHNLWKDCGEPRVGVVADIMRRTRAAYHYAIRKIRKSENEIASERFAATIMQNQNRRFLVRGTMY